MSSMYTSKVKDFLKGREDELPHCLDHSLYLLTSLPNIELRYSNCLRPRCLVLQILDDDVSHCVELADTRGFEANGRNSEPAMSWYSNVFVNLQESIFVEVDKSI